MAKRTNSVNGEIVAMADDEDAAFTADQEAFTQENAVNEAAQAREDQITKRARSQAEQSLIDDGEIERA